MKPAPSELLVVVILRGSASDASSVLDVIVALAAARFPLDVLRADGADIASFIGCVLRLQDDLSGVERHELFLHALDEHLDGSVSVLLERSALASPKIVLRVPDANGVRDFRRWISDGETDVDAELPYRVD